MLKPNLKRILLQKQEEGYMLDLNGRKMKPNMTNLAIALGVVKQQVTMWGSGASYPRPETLYKMAKVLDVSVNDLYTLEETEEELQKEREEIEKRLQELEEQAKQRKEAYRRRKEKNAKN
ncbi:helix-turn-helix domain-containing protein [Thermoactinomyces mirandus]|uniref:Helix-turn-helix transcriptional regulator n=1 Tax=Thermoactinomyces mirandus TaxID=2756294 RepID=A0A7W1XRP3_9BACL|nr:helix-turn-helix transcriptional regulator [Thermoactinomyces mirandus]MBA4601890.1 helix-turn-helix transcriptional regulator [Thermoactinomyces mirandus]